MKLRIAIGIGVLAGLAFAALTWHTSVGNSIQRVFEPAVPAAWLHPAKGESTPKELPAAAAAEVSRKEWMEKFDKTTDYRAFIQSALPAAQAHDPRAEYLIAQALTNCRGPFMDYRGSADPETQLQQELTRMAGPDYSNGYHRPTALPQWILDDHEKKVRRCLPLLTDIPGGQDADFWWQRALADGEPLARAEDLRGAAVTLGPYNNPSPEERAQKIQTMQKDLLLVMQSGDPDALYAAAVTMGNLGGPSTSLHSPAVVLAACQLGADCSMPGCSLPPNGPVVDINDNPVPHQSCPAGADIPYLMQRDLGQESYAALDAQAQQIKQQLSAGDYQAVAQYLTAAN